MDIFQEKNIEYYDRHASEWANNANFRFSGEMREFHELLPAGRILEIGSGSGLDAINLISYGYDYVGVDASRGLLEVAQKRNPLGVFKLVKAQDLSSNFDENSFDGFWTVATLLHVPKDEMEATLNGIHKIVRNNGMGFITIKQGRGEREHKETGRMFNYYLQPGFSKLLIRQKFEILKKEIEKAEGVVWLKFFVKVKK